MSEARSLDTVQPGSEPEASPHVAGEWTFESLLSRSGLRRFGAVYVLALIAIIFTIVEPQTFPNVQTVKSILNQYSVDALVALGVTVPLAAGLFDLSAGSVVGMSGMSAAWLLGHTTLPAGVIILLVLAMGVAAGLLNSLVVVVLGVDSFIGTLGTGSIFAAATLGVSGNQVLANGVTKGAFSKVVATANLGGIAMPVFFAIVAMILTGVALERTVGGRHTYSLGFAPDVATMLGLRIGRIKAVSFVASSVLASVAGMALLGSVGGADPAAGPSYLLGAFAAAFLGATQVRPGRFNPWGTVIAVLMVGTGDVGLLLSASSTWAPNVFEGVVLITAIWLAGRVRRR